MTLVPKDPARFIAAAHASARLREDPLMPTAKQISWIHGLATKAGLDDDAYRGLLAQYGGVTSSRDLSVAGFERVLGRLKVLTGGTSATSRPGSSRRRGTLALQGRSRPSCAPCG